jgi:hypothetical protein
MGGGHAHEGSSNGQTAAQDGDAEISLHGAAPLFLVCAALAPGFKSLDAGAAVSDLPCLSIDRTPQHGLRL